MHFTIAAAHAHAHTRLAVRSSHPPAPARGSWQPLCAPAAHPACLVSLRFPPAKHMPPPSVRTSQVLQLPPCCPASAGPSFLPRACLFFPLMSCLSVLPHGTEPGSCLSSPPSPRPSALAFLRCNAHHREQLAMQACALALTQPPVRELLLPAADYAAALPPPLQKKTCVSVTNMDLGSLHGCLSRCMKGMRLGTAHEVAVKCEAGWLIVVEGLEGVGL